jgi:hypothetical protein
MPMKKWLGMVIGDHDISGRDVALMLDIYEVLTLNDMGNSMLARSGSRTISVDVQGTSIGMWSCLGRGNKFMTAFSESLHYA